MNIKKMVLKKTIIGLGCAAFMLAQSSTMIANAAHAHNFNRPIKQTGGYTVQLPHTYVYGYDINRNQIIKTCAAKDVYINCYMQCSCGVYEPNDTGTGYKSRAMLWYNDHPSSSDPADCQIGRTYYL